ncbi:MAG: hypothetical protein KDA65_19110, partial [Planctomycetaceae bacterium]|nr:hypothetical protein [Planctomycetaceae bacterium]
MANSESSFGLKMMLSFFIVTTLGLSVWLFLGYRDKFDVENQLAVKTSEATNAKNQQGNAERQRDAIQASLGIAESAPEKVIEKLSDEIKEVSGEQMNSNFVSAIVAQRDKLQNEKRRADDLLNKLESTITKMDDNEKIAQQRIQTEAEAKTKAQRDL